MAIGLTSHTAALVATPVATFKMRYIQKALFLYVDFLKDGSNTMTMTIGVVNPKVHATNTYQETLFATATMVAITATFDTTGKYRFQLTPSLQETSLVVTFAGSGSPTVVCDIVPE